MLNFHIFLMYLLLVGHLCTFLRIQVVLIHCICFTLNLQLINLHLARQCKFFHVYQPKIEIPQLIG